MGSRASSTIISTSLRLITSFSWWKKARRVCAAALSSLTNCVSLGYPAPPLLQTLPSEASSPPRTSPSSFAPAESSTPTRHRTDRPIAYRHGLRWIWRQDRGTLLFNRFIQLLLQHLVLWEHRKTTPLPGSPTSASPPQSGADPGLCEFAVSSPHGCSSAPASGSFGAPSCSTRHFASAPFTE